MELVCFLRSLVSHRGGGQGLHSINISRIIAPTAAGPRAVCCVIATLYRREAFHNPKR